MAHSITPNHSADPPEASGSSGGTGADPQSQPGRSDPAADPARQETPAPTGTAAGAAPGSPNSDGAIPFTMPAFGPQLSPAQSKAIDLLSDVNLNVKIELGRTRMLVEDVLRLSEGAVVELDKLAGDPVDIYVNDRPIARGEVLVLNDNFCVRIHEIIQNPADGEVPKAARKAS